MRLLCLSLYVLGLVVWGLGCPALAEMSMVRAWHQVDDTTFSEMVTSQDQYSLIYFYMPECPKCEAFKPTWTKLTAGLATTHAPVSCFQVDVSLNPGMVKQLSIKGFPAIVLMQGKRYLGTYTHQTRSVDRMWRWLQTHVQGVSFPELPKGGSVVHEGKVLPMVDENVAATAKGAIKGGSAVVKKRTAADRYSARKGIQAQRSSKGGAPPGMGVDENFLLEFAQMLFMDHTVITVGMIFVFGAFWGFLFGVFFVLQEKKSYTRPPAPVRRAPPVVQ